MIKLNLLQAPNNVVESIKGAPLGYNAKTDAISVKFPGVSSVDIQRDTLSVLSDKLYGVDNADLSNCQSAIVSRTFSVNSDGSCSFRFSDEERARTINIPAGQARDVADLLALIYDMGRKAAKEAEESE